LPDFFFPFFADAVFADADAKLPACCRLDGKHHCAIATQQDPPSDLGVHGVREKCPYFPAASAAPVQSKIVLPGLTQAIFASIASHPAVQARTESYYRISSDRATQKRGPPALLS
jgi:hypothetical protein